VHIAASPETVWSFWTDAERLCEWWGSSAEVTPEPNGIFRVVMSPTGPVMRGSYLELQPFHRLVFSFGWENNAPGELLAPGSTTVEIILTPIADDTELVLRHSQMPPTHAEAHTSGWARFVGDRLPIAAAGGVNL
jgi:uncharacterized protein YndB with AHSA1/START domain